VLTVQSLGIHQPAYFPAFGEGYEDAFRNVNIAEADIFLKLGLSKGDKFFYENGIYQVVVNRSGGTITKGSWVKLFFGGATRLGTVAAAPAATKAAIASSFNLTRDQLVNPEKAIPSWVFITSGTGIGQRRRIRENTDSTDASANLITVSKAEFWLPLYQDPTVAPDAFGTAPATGDGLSVICPWEVIPTAAAYDFAQGVAMGDFSDGQWGVICVAGLALAKCVGSTDALVAGKPIVISGTAGVAKGQVGTPANATAAMQEASSICGYAIDAYSGASALRHVWVSGESAI
jgi:hypothetical protein